MPKHVPLPEDAPSQCVRCNAALEAVHHERGLILAERCPIEFTFDEVRCVDKECGYRSLDGAEFCLLRKSTFVSRGVLGRVELFFAYDFLYDYVRSLAKCTHFYTRFAALLQRYSEAGEPPEQLEAMQSLYRHAKEAVMDFVDLMGLPYREELRCKCDARHQHLVADGIMVAIKREMLHIVGTWLPPLPAEGESVPAVFGSDYHERFAIRSKAMRDLLRSLVSKQGLSAEEYDELLALCEGSQPAGRIEDEAIASIVRKVAVGGLTTTVMPAAIGEQPRVILAPEADRARVLLKDLGAHAPAISLLPAYLVPVLQRFTQCVRRALGADGASAASEAMRQWSREDELAIRESAPSLWDAMRWLESSASAPPHVQPGSMQAPTAEALCALFERVARVRMQSLCLPAQGFSST